MSRFRALTLAVLAVLLLGTGLAGCGQSDGITKLTAAKQLAEARSEVSAAKSLTLKGEVQSSATEKLKIDLRYAGKDATGTLAFNGAEMKILAIGDKVWVRPSDEFWKSQAGAAAPKVIAQVKGRWINATGEASFSSIVALTKRSFLTQSILKADSAIKKGKPKKVDGTDCVSLTKANDILYLDRENGRPVQIRPGGKGSASGEARFSYGDVKIPKAPAKADQMAFSELGAG